MTKHRTMRPPLSPTTFTRYLRSSRNRVDMIGEFARDWVPDTHRGRPRGAYKWEAVERYLRDRGAVENCIEAAKLAWSDWKIAKAIWTSGQGKNRALSHGQVDRA